MAEITAKSMAYNHGYEHGYAQGKKDAEAALVRCKDCKHWGGVVFGNVCRRWSAPLAGMRNNTKPDDFCSYGERREDG